MPEDAVYNNQTEFLFVTCHQWMEQSTTRSHMTHPSTNAFKNRLDRHWEDMGVLGLYSPSTSSTSTSIVMSSEHLSIPTLPQYQMLRSLVMPYRTCTGNWWGNTWMWCVEIYHGCIYDKFWPGVPWRSYKDCGEDFEHGWVYDGKKRPIVWCVCDGDDCNVKMGTVTSKSTTTQSTVTETDAGTTPHTQVWCELHFSQVSDVICSTVNKQ